MTPHELESASSASTMATDPTAGQFTRPRLNTVQVAKLTLTLADQVHSLESMRHLSTPTSRCSRADWLIGMSMHATGALEQSRRSAPVNFHVVWRHQLTREDVP